jgi:hypothetical protein
MFWETISPMMTMSCGEMVLFCLLTRFLGRVGAGAEGSLTGGVAGGTGETERLLNTLGRDSGRPCRWEKRCGRSSCRSCVRCRGRSWGGRSGRRRNRDNEVVFWSRFQGVRLWGGHGGTIRRFRRGDRSTSNDRRRNEWRSTGALKRCATQLYY